MTEKIEIRYTPFYLSEELDVLLNQVYWICKMQVTIWIDGNIVYVKDIELKFDSHTHGEDVYTILERKEKSND